MNRWALAMIVLAGLVLHAGAGYAQTPSSLQGEKIANLHCSRCHVIPGRNNMGIGSTPSFKTMVTSKSKAWRDKFEAFFALAPHPAFVTIKEMRTERSGPAIAAPIILSLREIDDLMAYVDLLAAELRKH
ncbi:MAG: c-type cytochrome [Pseudomonadota bacterium]